MSVLDINRFRARVFPSFQDQAWESVASRVQINAVLFSLLLIFAVLVLLDF